MKLLWPRTRRLVVMGLLDKYSAAELGISEATVNADRTRLRQKIRAQSLFD